MTNKTTPHYDVAIIGAGLIGASIAHELLEKKYNIILIDKNINKSPVVANNGTKIKFITGDACELATLETADIKQVNAVVSTTMDDKINLIVSLLAKQHYNIPNVIAKVNDLKNEWLFNDSWGVDKYVSSTRIITSLIEDSFVTNNFVKLFSFGNSSLFEYSVDKSSELVGKTLKNIKIPKVAELILILRDNRNIKPDVDGAIEADDRMLFMVPDGSEHKLTQLV